MERHDPRLLDREVTTQRGNQVERWFGLLTERQIKRGVHRSTRELESAIYEYVKATNANPKPFVWVKSADEILARIARFCETQLEGGAE